MNSCLRTVFFETKYNAHHSVLYKSVPTKYVEFSVYYVGFSKYYVGMLMYYVVSMVNDADSVVCRFGKTAS